MPGSTINTTILTASNQLIKSQNDIETAIVAVETAILAGNQEVTGEAITAIETAILAGNEELATLATMVDPVIEYHPYLRYLQYLQMIAERQSTGGGGTIPGTFGGDNQTYLSSKCIAANWIWQKIWDCFDWLSDHHFWEGAGVLLSAFVGGIEATFVAALGLGTVATLGPAALLAIPSIGLAWFLGTAVDVDAVISALETHKSDIIQSIYSAVSLDLVELQLTLPLSRLSNISEDVVEIINQTYPLSVVEQQIIGLIIDYYAMTALFKDQSSWPTKWQAGPPTGAVTCGEVACIELDSLLEYPLWNYGTPSLLVGGEFIDGQTTAQWDSQVYKVLFRSVLGNPISFSIDAISTPSIDIYVHHCDGTFSEQNEVLAAAFPMTILDALEVHLIRTSSVFTVTLGF
jgi:hypothetical protein